MHGLRASFTSPFCSPFGLVSFHPNRPQSCGHSQSTHTFYCVCLPFLVPRFLPGRLPDRNMGHLWAAHPIWLCMPYKLHLPWGWHLCCLRGPGALGATCPGLIDPRGSASNAAAGAFLDRYVVTLFERLHSFLQDIWVHWRHNWEQVWSHSFWCKQRAAPPESVWLRGWYIGMKHNTKIFFSLGCLP